MYKMIFTLLSTLSLIAFADGCADGNCREVRDKEAKASGVVTTDAKNDLSEHVRVYKYDGSKQCGQGTATPIVDMQKDLVGIKVYSAINKMDHLMHPMVCGSATGKANVYEISTQDLSSAKKAGFKEWLWE